MAIFLASSCFGSGMRISRTPSLQDAVMSASVTPSGSGSDRGKGPVTHLPAQVALLLPLFLLAAFGLDVQHPAGDGQLHVLIRVDAGQIGPHHQGSVLPVFLHPDQVPRFRPAR